MKYQPNKDYISNDCVITPPNLAKGLIKHFKPTGKILDPCKGTGNFYNNYPKESKKYYCEISEGKDFFKFKRKVDWIITNPPWSKIRNFLNKSMSLSNNICFLTTINHLWTRARIKDIEENKFGIVEILIFDTPKEFKQTGFQLGMWYIKKNYKSNIIFRRFYYEKKGKVCKCKNFCGGLSRV